MQTFPINASRPGSLNRFIIGIALDRTPNGQYARRKPRDLMLHVSVNHHISSRTMMSQLCSIDAREHGLVWSLMLVTLAVQLPESDHSMTWSHQQLGYAYTIMYSFPDFSCLTRYVVQSINTLVSCPPSRFFFKLHRQANTNTSLHSLLFFYHTTLSLGDLSPTPLYNGSKDCYCGSRRVFCHSSHGNSY